ncbi:MAG TPA: tetratricopeptide repeat protein [Isosphaeraceae bacterium]|nr:tetratricopeptide repeat protein [Isosphaeraceae bacterium]
MPGVLQAKGRLRGIAIGAALLAAATCAVGVLTAWLRRSPDPAAQAVHAYDRGGWAVAARLARQALKARPDDLLALKILARSSAQLGQDDSALAVYTRRLDPKAMEAEDHALMGLALQRRGQTDAALRAWDRALEGGLISPWSLDEMARHYLRARRQEEAGRVAQRLSRLPGWEARGSMMLGTTRAALNDVAGAAESFRRALSLDPREIDRSAEPVPLGRLIARTFLRMASPLEARARLQAILAQGPDPEAAWLLSRAYLQEGDKARAQQAMDQAGSYRAENPLEPEPAPYVGETRCQACHLAIFRDSLTSRHTRSFHRGAQLRDLPRPDRPLPDPDDPKVTHKILERDGALREQTLIGGDVYEAVVDYAFGTSDRYVTMVSRDAHGGYRIARLSYYDTAQGRGWDRSALDKTHLAPGHGAAFQGEAIGVREGVAKCLYCHTTNPRSGPQATGPETADRAIGCERCHGPGGHHVAAVAAGFSDPAIVNPAVVSPGAVTTRQCNDCHILGRDYRQDDLGDPGWTRSQGVGWTFSRCNTESGGAFGCVTCHDPHKPAKATTTAQYEAKCLSCHRSTGPAPAAGGDTPRPKSRTPIGVVAAPTARACPVDRSQGCLGCHMPRVRIDSLHLDLADHSIRIHRPKP